MFNLTGKPRHETTDAQLEAYVRSRIAHYDRILGVEQTETRALPAGFERFPIRDFEIRANQTADGRNVLTGYAAKFDRLSQKLDGGGFKFRECLRKGCFSRTLRSSPDVLLLRGHEVNDVLARGANGSLVLREDNTGLAFEATLSGSSMSRDVYTDVKNEYVRGMSFGFRARDEEWPKEGCDDDDPNCDPEDRGRRLRLRVVKDLDLFEISTTPMPAYSDTQINARALPFWPTGTPQTLPMEIRALIASGAGGELTEEEKELRTRMRIEAIRATL